MKIAYDSGGKGRDGCNASDEQPAVSCSKSRREFSNFFTDALAFAESKARIVAIATAMTVTAVACTGNHGQTGNPDSNVDADVDGVEDGAPDGSCGNTGTPVEGDVPATLAKTVTEPIHFNGPAATSVSGAAEVTVGGELEIDGLLMLGNCPEDSTSLAAFGAEGGTVRVRSSYRLDIAEATAELPAVDGDACPPVDHDVPISMFKGPDGSPLEANLVAIPASLGPENGSVEVGLSDPLAISDTLEFPISGSDYAVTLVAVISDPSTIGLGARVLSQEGIELSETALSAVVGSKTSRTLRVYGLGDANSVLPDTASWTPKRAPRHLDGAMVEEHNAANGALLVCIRPCSTEDSFMAVETGVEISPDLISGAVQDGCGNLFAEFDIVSVSARFLDSDEYTNGVEPAHLAGEYSLLADFHYGEGAAMGVVPRVFVYVRRAASGWFIEGTPVTMQIEVTANLESKLPNPATGVKDEKSAVFVMLLRVPDHSEHLTVCGCDYYSD